ncbi:MAG TPA: hypothetical protein VFH42_08820 [Sporolactobacillaceae bacterium]|nr:hypothetical protein [Sporolactobacillaceae bacterium]
MQGSSPNQGDIQTGEGENAGRESESKPYSDRSEQKKAGSSQNKRPVQTGAG